MTKTPAAHDDPDDAAMTYALPGHCGANATVNHSAMSEVTQYINFLWGVTVVGGRSKGDEVDWHVCQHACAGVLR
jgi:hypothetical protein